MAERRFSHQREQIFQAVCGRKDHPTAEMVYQQLKPDMPRLSLGTVYRNLHQMAQEGRLQELPGPVVRFDGDTSLHTHFRCACCGRVADMAAVPYDTGLDRAAQSGGWRVTGHILVFTGLCPACAGQGTTA